MAVDNCNFSFGHIACSPSLWYFMCKFRDTWTSGRADDGGLWWSLSEFPFMMQYYVIPHLRQQGHKKQQVLSFISNGFIFLYHCNFCFRVNFEHCYNLNVVLNVSVTFNSVDETSKLDCIALGNQLLCKYWQL